MPTNYFVDPSLGSDTGDGSKTTPWGRASGSVTQYALDTITASASGDVINIKSGAADVLTANLNLTTYGIPTEAAPLMIQGYDTDAGDGGKGEIDGDGSYTCFNGTEDYVIVADLKAHNCGTGYMIRLDNYCGVFRCEVYDAGRGIDVGAYCDVLYNYVYQCISYHILGHASFGNYSYNYTANSGVACGHSIYPVNQSIASHNIIVLDGASGGLRSYGINNRFHNNIIFSQGGSGAGINIDYNNIDGTMVINNIIEGFSAGSAVDWNSHAYLQDVYINNAYYNCGTIDEAKTGVTFLLEENNETLSESPFEKQGSLTYNNRHNYFKLRNIGNVSYGAYPNQSRMAKSALSFKLKNPTLNMTIGF